MPAVVVAAIVVPIPTVIVFEAPAGAVPVSGVIAPPFPSGNYPVRADIGSAGPITGVPFVVVANGVPVALNPNVLGSGSYRADRQDSWGRRRSDSDPDRYLAEAGGDCEEYQSR